MKTKKILSFDTTHFLGQIDIGTETAYIDMHPHIGNIKSIKDIEDMINELWGIVQTIKDNNK